MCLGYSYARYDGCTSQLRDPAAAKLTRGQTLHMVSRLQGPTVERNCSDLLAFTPLPPPSWNTRTSSSTTPAT